MKRLINTLGFSKEKIILLYNEKATKRGIEELLGELLPQKVSQDDRVIIYFSGHGDQEKLNGEYYGYLVPSDGQKKSLKSTCLAMSDLVGYFSDKINASQILYIFDSCFSGIAGHIHAKGNTIQKEDKKQIEAFIRSRGRQVLTAGGPDETVAMSKEWNNHSVYTFYLLKGLRGGADYNHDKIITIHELQVYLDDTVPKEAKQTPELKDLNNCEGQFVFYYEGDY